MRSNRITTGIRGPALSGGQRRPRVSIEDALRLLRQIKPWAAPKLPPAYARCFDRRQRQVRPLPGQTSGTWAQRITTASRVTARTSVEVPAQRRPHPLERGEGRRAPR